MLGTVAGILIGGVITFLVSRHYYQRASKELQGETEKLRGETKKLQELHVLTINILNAANLLPERVVITRDEAGTPTGFTYQLAGRAQPGASAYVNSKVKRADGTDAPKQEAQNEEDSQQQE